MLLDLTQLTIQQLYGLLYQYQAECDARAAKTPPESSRTFQAFVDARVVALVINEANQRLQDAANVQVIDFVQSLDAAQLATLKAQHGIADLIRPETIAALGLN